METQNTKNNHLNSSTIAIKDWFSFSSYTLRPNWRVAHKYFCSLKSRMSSSDEQKFLLDLIAGYMKPWRPHMSTGDAEPQDSSGHAPVEMLCLRRSQLTDIEGSIVNNHMLKVSLACAFLIPLGWKEYLKGEGIARCFISLFLESKGRNERSNLKKKYLITLAWTVLYAFF